MAGHEGRQVRAALLLLAVEEDLHVQGQLAGRGDHRLDGFQVREVLPLVVAAAPGVDAPVANRRRERRRLPEFQRLHRLHVVVPVQQQRATRAGHAPFSEHDRAAIRGEDVRVQPYLRHFLSEQPGALHQPDSLRADARLTQQPHEAVHRVLSVRLHVREGGAQRPPGG